MLNKSKIICLVDVALWFLLLVDIVLLEFMKMEAGILVVTCIIVLSLLLILHVWFVFKYLKNHKKVLSLQDQYIETLKPDKPLRFCPTDEELIKRHQEKIYVAPKTINDIPKIVENTNDDSIEEEMI